MELLQVSILLITLLTTPTNELQANSVEHELSNNAMPYEVPESIPKLQQPANPLNASSNKQAAAPYAIGDVPSPNQVEPSMRDLESHNLGRKNLVFSLSLNQTTRDEFERQHQGRDESWTLMDRNGSLSNDSGANLDLRKLLDALSANNNFTSEILMDSQHPGTLNITISNVRNSSLDIAEHLLLDDLISESRSAVNGSSILIDNHRLISKWPIRSKVPVISISAVTVPPIRQQVDIVAENYTIRKVADEANVFALNLLHQLNLENLGSHNIVQSPFVIYHGLSLLFSGASGDTAKELDRVLLGNQQSIYDNAKVIRDQDRYRLLASFNEVVNQLYQNATNDFHKDLPCSNGTSATTTNCTQFNQLNNGGDSTQHLIMANNLLFSPIAYEISNEFKVLLSSLYSNTMATKIEVGSTESIQVLNEWIRRATNGVIPAIFNKKNTFDEFNVMTLLSTSWLAQEWHDQFRRVSSSLRSIIRLKGQADHRGERLERDEPLLEFIDDNKGSHFVDYIESEPTRNIHHYHIVINNFMTDVLTIPFLESNRKLIVLTPLIGINSNYNSSHPNDGFPRETNENSNSFELPDTSLLSKLIAAMAGNPRKAMKSLWNTIAPDIITKKVYQSMRQVNHHSSSTNLSPLVRISLPLIKIEADASLLAPLNHIGLVNSFDKSQANYIGINGHPFNYNKLHLSNVIYKTTFNLNEHGINYDRTIKTLESMRISPNHRQQVLGETNRADSEELVDEIKLTKPFVFMICDTKTKLVLYTGVVRNPTK